jgi:hypothetical protein
MKKRHLLSILLSGLLFTACSSSKLTSSWKAKEASGKIYHNVMVWCILTEKDSLLKSNIEAHLVNDLANMGYHAISSISVFGPRSYKKLTEKEIVEQFKNSGVDAVITIVLLDKEEKKLYVPASLVNNPSSFNQVDRYYSTVYDKVFMPGYYASSTDYFWESNFFEVSQHRLVYSAHTRSFDPASANTLAHEYGVLLIKDMAKKKLVVNQAKKE